jgi:cytochrome c oxidase subunit 3
MLIQYLSFFKFKINLIIFIILNIYNMLGFTNNSKNNVFSGKTSHDFHLVSPSPWPLLTSFTLLAVVLSLTSFMHGYKGSVSLFFICMFFLLICMGTWWRDVIREATGQGDHNTKVQLGLRLGVILFIVSEIMFFFAFFWAFFHSSIAPSVFVGGVWPPIGIEVLNPFAVPLLNTIILVSSGFTLTWCHHALLAGEFTNSIISFVITIVLAIIFTFCQYFEYVNSSFTIADSVYGSCFYMATGFHGFHVFVGTLALSVMLYRLYNHQFTTQHHLGFEAAAWYWHFVDVVWLFLYITIYCWGGL